MRRIWIRMTRCRTALLSPASVLCMIGGTLLFVAACGGGDTPTSPSGAAATSAAPPPAPPPSAPPPPPAPVTRVVAEGSGFIPVLHLASVPFTTETTGTIGATVDWTFGTNDVDVYLTRGTDPCTIDQFNTNRCPFLGLAESLTAKPEQLSVPNLAAGPYTVYVGNFGPTDESISIQITLTSTPGASAASTSNTRFGSIKGTLNEIIRAD